jgi:VPDSG-CTERM motif
MKKNQLFRVTVIAVGVLLPATMVRAQVLPTYDVAEGPTGLTTSIPGATIGGVLDNWVLTLPAGDLWGSQLTLYLAEPETVGNPESTLTMNILAFPTADTLSFVSDVTANGKTGLPSSVSDTLVAFTGGPLATVVFTDTGDPKTSVPDGAATCGLLGMSLVGLYAIRRRLKR